jgi:O-succinylbenzoic acid--CoA ligase
MELPDKDTPEFLVEGQDGLAVRNRCGKRVNARVLWLSESLDLKKGDRVALVAVADQPSIETIFACLKLGLELLLLPERASVEELGDLVRRAKSILVLGDAPMLGIPSHSIPTKLEKIEQAFSLDLESRILFPTSGSSGPSKIAIHKLSSLLEVAKASNQVTGLEGCDNWLLTLPLNHVGGFSVLLRVVLAGAKLSVPERQGLSRLFENFLFFSPSHISLVPVMLRELVESEIELDFSTLKVALVSGDALSSNLTLAAVQTGIPVLTSYGSTEVGSTAFSNTIVDADPAISSYGNPLAGIEIKIIDRGEIALRGPNLFLGYLGEEADYSSRWFATGDLGEIDSAGRLSLKGRKSRVIISGGENVHPEEIESVARQVEGVEEAIVVAESDQKWGQRPVLLVKAIGASEDLEQRLLHRMKESLSEFKVPSAIRVVEKFKYLANGKLDHRG